MDWVNIVEEEAGRAAADAIKLMVLETFAYSVKTDLFF